MLKTNSFELLPKFKGIMKKIVYVNTAEVKIGIGETMLRSSPIGSCVVVAAYDSKKKIGAMAHIMLPGNAPQHSLEKTKYASDSIEQLLNQMFEVGANANNIKVCLVGAGNVLQDKDDIICEANIESTTQILKERNITVKASVLGGIKRKSVCVDVENGCISCAEGDEKEKVLWKTGQEQGN